MSFWDRLRSFFGMEPTDEAKHGPSGEATSVEAEASSSDEQPVGRDGAQEAQDVAKIDEVAESLVVETSSEAVAEEVDEADELPVLKVTPFEVPSSSYRSPLLTAYLPTRLAEMIEQAHLVDQSRAISPKLIGFALEDGFLTPARALSLARNQPTPVLRADALLAILAWQPPAGMKKEVEDVPFEAWQAASVIPVAKERVTRLAKLRYPGAHEAAQSAIDTIHDPGTKVKALVEIGEWATALKTWSQIGSQFEQANIFLELVDQLPEMWLQRAVKLVQSLDEYGSYTIKACCKLIPRLPRPLPEELLEWVWKIPDDLTQVAIGACVAYHLKDEALEAWVERLREEAEKVEYPTRRIKVWLHLLLHLPSEEYHPMLMRLLAIAREQEDDLARAEALGSIALYLPSKERETVLPEAAQALTNVNDSLNRNRLWGDWAKGLCKKYGGDVNTVQSGLIMMGNVQEPYLRAAYLQEVASYLARLSPKLLIQHIHRLLPDSTTQTIFWQQALPHLQNEHHVALWHHISTMQDATARKIGLLALAPHLPEQRKQMVSDALASAKQPIRKASLPILLAAVAKRFPSERDSLLERANQSLMQWDAANQVHILADMLAQLGDAAPASLWTQAISQVQQIDRLTSKSLAYTTLLAKAPAKRQKELALEALNFVLDADHLFMRQQRLLDLLPYLPDSELEPILRKSRTHIDAMQLPALLRALAPRLSPRLLSTTLEELLKLPAHRMRELAEGLVALLPYLSAEEAKKADEAAKRIRFPAPRLQVQAALASEGPLKQNDSTRRDTFADLLAEALDISLPASRVEALGYLARYLSDPQLSKVLHQALRVLLTIDDETSRAHQLNTLLPLTTAERADEMLYFVRQVGEDRLRAQLITTLVPHLPHQKVGALLPFVTMFNDMNNYDTVLSAIIPHLPQELLIEALLLIREHAQNPSLHNSLTTFAPRWNEMAQRVAIQNNSELILTLSAFAKGGSAQLMPALTALLPVLEKEGGSGLLTHLVRLVD